MAVHGSARQCTAYRGAGQPCNTVCGVSNRPPIDPARPVHVYVQLADHIAARIAAGDLQPGARLPAERDLAAEYGVSTDTVRRAVAVLRERALIVTLTGRGSYVNER
jgi:GntR family transcriptional regulator